MSSSHGPLAGVRVLELGSFIAGPFAGQLLGDYGAEVIKIEPPDEGDPMRKWGITRDGESLWWPAIARNKKSVAVDLRDERGRAVVIELKELERVSYQPLAEVFRAITPREARHAELGLEGLKRIVETSEGRAEAQDSVDYWLPRVAASFGVSGSGRHAMLAKLGLRHDPNETLLARWQADIAAELAALGLTVKEG